MSASNAIGFGFVPGETTHCFVVTIPRDEQDEVIIAEQLCFNDNAERADTPDEIGMEGKAESSCAPRPLVSLNLERWLCIENDVRMEFNRRLRRVKQKSGVWKNGDNPLALPYGQELTLLCWAIEEANVEEIAAAYRNWLAFTPEERQWLYATIAAATANEAEPCNGGWRRAIRLALVTTPAHNRPGLTAPASNAKDVATKPTATRPPTRKEKLAIETRIAQPSLPCLDDLPQ